LGLDDALLFFALFFVPIGVPNYLRGAPVSGFSLRANGTDDIREASRLFCVEFDDLDSINISLL
jgi:hypothetical protein